MKNLILTAAGLSTRFNGTKLKWMLTHPSGNWMLYESLKGVDFSKIDKVYLTFLKTHIEQYNCLNGIKMCINDLGITDKSEIVLLNESTKNQPETVFVTINKMSIKGQIIIEEVDHYFKHDIIDDNFLCYYNLNNTKNINPSNKSYLKIDDNNNVIEIVEKNVISPTFSCGCYSFKSSEMFCKFYEYLQNLKNLYLSTIISSMIKHGHIFKAIEGSDYIDWGTKQDWFNYIRQFKTIFIDLDGTLVKSSGKYMEPYWGETEGLTKNIEFINKLYNSNKVYIIITTSRPLKYKTQTLNQLKRENILYHDIIFGLFNCNRIIINDHSSSAPYPTCESINILRNSDDLERYIRDFSD
jgi:hypothetical protein